jgi:hypothetical protein
MKESTDIYALVGFAASHIADTIYQAVSQELLKLMACICSVNVISQYFC